MEFLNLHITTYTGDISFYDDNATVNIKLTQDEKAELIDLAGNIFQRRQASIANNIATAHVGPILLEAQPVPRLDPLDDEIPF